MLRQRLNPHPALFYYFMSENVITVSILYQTDRPVETLKIVNYKTDEIKTKFIMLGVITNHLTHLK